MDFSKTYSFESKTHAGVVVTLRRIGPKKRAEIELQLSEVRAKQRELRMRYAAIKQRLDKRLMEDSDVAARMAALTKQSVLVPFEVLAKADLPEDILEMSREVQLCIDTLDGLSSSQIQPAFIKAAVEAFNSELTYNGQPASAELLCEYGPEELFDELAKRINEGAYFDTAKAENLSSPTTSGAQMDGKSTTAPIANEANGGKSEDVANTTPNQ